MTEFTDQQKRGWRDSPAALTRARPRRWRAAHARRGRSRSGPMPCSTPPRTAPSRRAASWSPRRTPSASAIRSTAGTRSSGAPRQGEFPKGIDVFLTKYQGLFYVAPAQDSFMCRLRIPNGILNAWQMRGLADAADSFGGGYADVTTRANLQIREIPAQPRRRPAAGGAGARPHLARLGRRQYPQHHRQPDRRHRPAGTDRHAAAVQRDASLHPQSPRDVRPAAQVQHRLRRRRQGAGAGGHQRHRLRRLPGHRGSSSLASISACSSAASPAIRISPSRPACC